VPNKVGLKKKLMKKQSNRCALTGNRLPLGSTSLVDTDRRTPKAKNGDYRTESNVRVVDPVAHMKRHGILRERPEWLDELKSLVDDREQTMKLCYKIENQIGAYDRKTDHRLQETNEYLKSVLKGVKARLAKQERGIAKFVRGLDHPLVKSALGVKGIGELTVAVLLTYVELEKANTVSSLWQYAGLDRPAHQRFEKNPEQQARREARGADYYGSTDLVPTGWGGNRKLRTALYRTADSCKRNRKSPYRLVYDQVKARLEVSERIVKSRLADKTWVEVAWKDVKPCHRDGAALRAVMKAILADWWFVGRELAGLPTRPPYAIEKLAHTTFVSPRERGWVF